MATNDIATLKIYTEETSFELVVSEEFVRSSIVDIENLLSNILVVDLLKNN